MSTSSMKTLPEVGLSSAPIMLNSVDLPEPDGPMMERYSPALMAKSTPLSASTRLLPILKTLVTSVSLTTLWD